MLDYIPIFKCSFHHCQRKKKVCIGSLKNDHQEIPSLQVQLVFLNESIWKKSAQLTQKNGKIIMDIHLWCCQEAKDLWSKAESKPSSILKPKILLEVPLLSPSSTKDSNFNNFKDDNDWKLHPQKQKKPVFYHHNWLSQHQNPNHSSFCEFPLMQKTSRWVSLKLHFLLYFRTLCCGLNILKGYSEIVFMFRFENGENHDS